ncbi:MAG: tripartite tricarboxylate transporter substrate binding protein [Rhizobiales bacterium]|nr:tripartite tricarboxylate transporter substrate binding protein [Hyphomicrobiales bacterium]
MKLARREFLRLAAAGVVLPFTSHIAKAQAYPTGPVRILVGFPAGGPVDIAARVISPWLSERLGQPFVVENLPGESGNLATKAVVNAPPDGSTLLLCGPVNTINTTLFQNLDFDFTRDIAPVAGISRVPLVAEVNPTVKARTVPEFLALARAQPGQIKVAYAGRGTPQHIGIELFKMMAGVDLTLVPYLGSAPALADLLSGEVHAMFDPIPSSIAHIRSGRLIPLAVTSLTRSEALPNVPAMNDFVPGYEAGSWFGIGAPKNTPDSVISRLNEEVNAGLGDPKIKARLAELGATAIPQSPTDFGSFIASETERFAKVIRTAKITAG